MGKNLTDLLQEGKISVFYDIPADKRKKRVSAYFVYAPENPCEEMPFILEYHVHPKEELLIIHTPINWYIYDKEKGVFDGIMRRTEVNLARIKQEEYFNLPSIAFEFNKILRKNKRFANIKRLKQK